MYAIWMAFLASLLIAGVPTVVALIGGNNSRGPVAAIGSIAGVVLWIVNALLFYHGKPVVGLSWDSFYSSFWLWMIEFLVVVVTLFFVGIYEGDELSIGGLAICIVAVVGLVFGLVVSAGGVWFREDVLKNQLKVTVHDNVADIPKTDEKHILTVPRQVVNFKVKSALRGDATTRYAIDSDSRQVMVSGHMYWLTGIHPDDLIGDYSNVGGNARGYIVTDTENYNDNAQWKWDESLGIDDNPNLMKVHLRGYFQHDVERVVWNKYRHQNVVDLHLEVDDAWKPYYVGTISTRPLSFNMGRPMPSKVLVIDAKTGLDRVYDLDKAPAWVDRIWSKDTVHAALDAWGQWTQAPYNFWWETPTNRYKVSDSPELIATEDGLAWQVIMTSQKKDTVASYYVLVNARTGKADAYKVPELQLESKVAETVKASAPNGTLQLVPTHLTLHNINGTLTWVMPMLKKDADTGDDGESNFNGLALIPANNIVGTQVVLKTAGDVRGDAFRAYEQLLATSQTTSGPQSDAQKKDAKEAAVASVSPPVVENGTTVFYFTLVPGLAGEYRSVEFRVESNLNSEVKYLKPGNKVTITYRDTGKSPFTVVDFDDLALALR